MKYLKLFEDYPVEPIQPKQVEDDLRDICIELEDLGFSINVNTHTETIYIFKKSKFVLTTIPFNFSEVEEVVSRIKDYLGNNISSICVSKLNSYIDITPLSNLILRDIGNSMISTVKIEYLTSENQRRLKSLSESFDGISHNRRDEISIEIEDRLLDLKDEGYITKVEKFGTLPTTHPDSNFKIYVHRTDGEKFSEQMLLPYIEHLVSYMNSNGYKMETTHYMGSHYHDEQWFVSSLQILFLKDNSYRRSNVFFGKSISIEPDRHFNTNESLSTRDMLVEIEDRLVDLQMNGYDTQVEHFISDQDYFVRVMYNSEDKFSVDMILDHIEHLLSFMDSKGYEMSTTNYKDYEYRHEENEFYVSALTLEFYEKKVDGFKFNEVRINTFNQYNESIEEPIDDVVKDICIEFEDMGYTVRYSEEPVVVGYRDNGGLSITITKMKKVEGGIHGATERSISEPINVREIRDTLDRLKDYLEDRLVYIHCYVDDKVSVNDGWYDLEEDFHTDDINGVMFITIKIDR